MPDLRSYMAGEFFEDTRILDELDQAMIQVGETFDKTYDPIQKSWPYELRPNTPTPAGKTPATPKRPSESTTGMILCAVLSMRDEWEKSSWRRASSGMPYLHDFAISRKIAAGLIRQNSSGDSNLLESVKALIDVWHERVRASARYVAFSRTFGEDDPMLLSWVLDLTRYCSDQSDKGKLSDKHKELLSRVLQQCSARAESLNRAAKQPRRGKMARPQTLGASIMTPPSYRQVGESSYILMRFAGLLRSVMEDDQLLSFVDSKSRTEIEHAQQYLSERFETRLHDHLSFAEIVDSRFDPTELAFCLNGMLLTRKDAVSKSLFDRVMSVLRIDSEQRGYWRTETPMLYQTRGDVLFTVSVEAVNAILASFALFDGRWCLHDSIASENIDLIKRYWRWLKARNAVVKIGTHDLTGWHSEHVNDPYLIHLWETSQVAEFLVNFRDQLKRYVARKSLTLAACSYKTPTKPVPVRVAPGADRRPEGRWTAACDSMEPVTSLGDHYKIYQRIGEHFVTPRAQQMGKPDFSMLLYGPPGTGKTTVASSLAWALDYPLITVTVSDFLADGAAIEARAKDLFDMLRSQPRSVVLFDEIDQFMLDRDSEYFREQETVFQFLTPGMLTKLNDLRASESVLFIMATNYAERIDAAIKRQGRIDQHFLLLPVDRARRKQFVEDLWKGKINADAAARVSCFLGYGDISSVRSRCPGPEAVDALADMPPAAKPDIYLVRFRDRKDKFIEELQRTPPEEFVAMIALRADSEGHAKGSPEWSKMIDDLLASQFHGLRLPDHWRDRSNKEFQNYLARMKK